MVDEEILPLELWQVFFDRIQGKTRQEIRAELFNRGKVIFPIIKPINLEIISDPVARNLFDFYRFWLGQPIISEIPYSLRKNILIDLLLIIKLEISDIELSEYVFLLKGISKLAEYCNN